MHFTGLNIGIYDMYNPNITLFPNLQHAESFTSK